MPLLTGSQLERFVRRLEHLEAPHRQVSLSEWERQFVKDMREKFESRETAEDLGCQVWNPSVSQWNTLSEIAEKVR